MMVLAMAACTLLVPFGLTNARTYALSVARCDAAPGSRDRTAVCAKLDEIVVSLNETRNDVVGFEHADPKEIKSKLGWKEAGLDA